MNIANIYPNGIAKTKSYRNVKFAVNPELKAKALEMISRGIRIVMVCEKLGVDKGTVAFWIKSKGGY